MKRQLCKAIGALGLSFALCAGMAQAADFTVGGCAPEIAADSAGGMLPLRYAAENSGYTVEWNEDRTIALKKGGHEIKLKINDDAITVDGEVIDLKYTPVLIGDKTYLPIEFYSGMFTEKYIMQTGESYTFMDKEPVSAENMMNTVREISRYPRSLSDETHAAAMQYVTDKFVEYGYEVERQPFMYSKLDFDAGGYVNRIGVNLIAVKKADVSPNGDVLILGAHYDGVPGMPAANDNGSGLSVLLELARVLRDLPSDTEIRFVAFDAEEEGLCGSKKYVSWLFDADNVIGMINFDMLGGAKAEYVGLHSADGRDCYLIDILRQNYEFCGVKREEHPGGKSDHMPFPLRLIPAIDFSHASVEGEYHSENDVAENISADMLEYAAKGGAAIAATIMSNLTPSYMEYAKPKESTQVLEITPETFIPLSGSVDELESELGVPLTQIESRDEQLQYKVNVKLFDLEQPLKLVYSGPMGALGVASPYIDLTDSGISYDEVKAMLDDKLGGGRQSGYSGYVYSSVYGNSYRLYYSEEYGYLYIYINLYADETKEAYLIENGGLIRLDRTNLNTDYEITKTKDGVSVTETSPRPLPEEEVSPRAQSCWDRLKAVLSPDELNELTYLVLESDGFVRRIMSIAEPSESAVRVHVFGNDDLEIPEEYSDLPMNIQFSIKFVLENCEEGEGLSDGNPLPGLRLTVDYNDLLDERGHAYSDEDLAKAVAMMKEEGAV